MIASKVPPLIGAASEGLCVGDVHEGTGSDGIAPNRPPGKPAESPASSVGVPPHDAWDRI